jgi:hypothetical protein
LEGQAEQPDLHEVQPVIGLEDRVDRRQQRLHHVIEEVAERHRDDDGEGRLAGCGMLRRRHGVGQFWTPKYR